MIKAKAVAKLFQLRPDALDPLQVIRGAVPGTVQPGRAPRGSTHASHGSRSRRHRWRGHGHRLRGNRAQHGVHRLAGRDLNPARQAKDQPDDRENHRADKAALHGAQPPHNKGDRRSHKAGTNPFYLAALAQDPRKDVHQEQLGTVIDHRLNENTDLSGRLYIGSRKLDSALNGTSAVRHKPHGVLAVISPWNMPALAPAAQIVPALIAGNVVVFKPSEKAPATGDLLTRCFHRAGISAAIVQLITGGPAEGQALVAQDGIDGVLFTGSAHAGVSINRKLAANPKDVSARLCLGDFWRLNGFDPLSWDGSIPKADELGGAAHLFPGKETTRGPIYAAIIADPAAGPAPPSSPMLTAMGSATPARPSPRAMPMVVSR